MTDLGTVKRFGILVTALLVASACAGGGWSTSERDTVRDVCLKNWGGTRSQCECVVEGTEAAYPDFGAFSRSTTWSNELISNLAPCGAGPLSG